MKNILPTKEQIKEFLAMPISGPVHMINLLKFREKSTTGSGSGQDSYNQYGANVVKMVQERGGRVVWQGRPYGLLIGDEESDKWDMAVIVEYPSRDAFIEMTSNPKYKEAHGDREAGLAYQA
ncbi:MAG: DUF1330 domain-containing protein [Actinomycetota bacterium]